MSGTNTRKFRSLFISEGHPASSGAKAEFPADVFCYHEARRLGFHERLADAASPPWPKRWRHDRRGPLSR